MAPTSSSKKKAATKVKRVPSRSSGTGVVKKGSEKTKLKPPPPKVIPKLPDDWPVSSHPPTIPKEASALRPGSVVQEKCNGEDIHLNRAAVVQPSITKEKGKYLIILPGMLSLKPSHMRNKYNASLSSSSSTAAGETLSQPSSSQKDDDENDNDVEMTQDSTTNDEATTKKRSAAGGGTAAAGSQSLGKLEGLAKGKPELKVPFPNGRMLVFPGKIIPTTSKYIMLNCSTSKNGSVQCKVRTSYCII